MPNITRSAQLCFVFVSSISTLAAGTDIYVSPTGNDAHTGLGPGDDTALRTVQAAVDRLQPGDTCWILSGVYRESVTFPRSGEPGRPISLKPYRDAHVVVSGCDPVAGWTPHEKGIWRAPMPWTLGSGRNQVFCNDRVLIEARHPNEPAPGLEMPVADLSPLWPTFGEFSIADPAQHPDRLVSPLLDGYPDDYWKGALYYGIHYEGWCGQTGVIEHSEPGAIQVGDRTRGWWHASPEAHKLGLEEGRGMIVGHMHALDRPGEWHWQDNVLYLIPREGGEPVNVEAKHRQLAFDLSGLQYLCIEGITVHGASLKLKDSAHCVIDGCTCRYISHFTRQYGIGQVEHGRDTIKSGETGIYVSGHDNAFLNCSVRFSAGAGFHLRGYHHTIHNCLIDQVSYTSHYLNAITDAVDDYNDYENFHVGGHVITFNTICNAGRHFFNFYGNGTSLASRTRGPMDYSATLFAHNHLFNGMLQTRDAGFLTGYYGSGGTLNGLNSVVAYNALHDSYDQSAMRWGKLGIVYLDAGTCNVDLHHNLLWAAPGSLQRGMWFNTCCVDIRAHDNVFHPEFVRSCSQLREGDFPGGVPFRFGHDFEHPPARLTWPLLEQKQIEAETCGAQSAGVVKTEAAVVGLRDGDWINLGDVDFDQRWQSATLRFSSARRQLNTDRSSRAAPRHHHATDPLVMEAVVSDASEEHIRKQWTFVYHVQDGAWLRFNHVPLGDGYQRFRVVYGNQASRSSGMEVRLDRVDGPVIGHAALPPTDMPRGGNVQIYREVVGQLDSTATGTRDLFFVFRNPDGTSVGEFEYFRLEEYRGVLPLQENEVQLQLRVGSVDGPKIGQFYPRATGGAEQFGEFVTTLEPAQGRQPLFLVVRSAAPEPIGAIDSLGLVRAAPTTVPDGLGQAPLSDTAGHIILPAPSYVPRSQPGRHFLRESAERRQPQPLLIAIPFNTSPQIDGNLGEWTRSEHAVTIGESMDGSPSPAPAGTAWVGYDAEALYVAIRQPLVNRVRQKSVAHLWDQDDAVEVAFRNSREASAPVICLHGFPDGFWQVDADTGISHTLEKKLADAITYRATERDDAWSCEWRIPLAACSLVPDKTPDLQWNLSVRQSAYDTLVCWRGTGTASRIVEYAGTLVFPGPWMAQTSLPQDGLSVWLDAADTATVERDEAGNVQAWQNKGSLAGQATQANPQRRPAYALDTFQGKPALRFHENRTTCLELPDLSQDKVTATVLVVFTNPVAGSPVNHDARLFTASDGHGYDYQIGLAATVPGMETGGPRQSVSVFRDRWAKCVRIGCFSPNDQTYFTGDIAEILVYSRELSPAELLQARTYLTIKWRL